MIDWYEVVHDRDLQQGDSFSRCAVLVPLPSEELAGGIGIEVGLRRYNVVVMSQSCDLAQGKQSLVLVCPHWDINKFADSSEPNLRDFFRSRIGREDIRRGNTPAYHMLNRCDLPGFEREIQVVDFRSVFSVSFEYLSSLTTLPQPRLR